MKVLVVGGGGREHALAWKFSREHGVDEVLCAPGNPGIASVARVIPVNADDIPALAELAERENGSILTVVGPELSARRRHRRPAFTARGLRAIRTLDAPRRSSSAAKCSRRLHGAARNSDGALPYLPHAAEARRSIWSGELGFPVVVKADGLAAGKGVVVAADSG